jgi:hypothetical protein
MTRSTEKLIRAALRDGCREHCDALIDELRRLSAVEAQRDALLEACKAYDQWADKTFCYDRELRPIRAQIRAAIKQAEGEKT